MMAISTDKKSAHHSLIIIENDPLLYKRTLGDDRVRIPRFPRCCKEAAILLYSPATDTLLEDMTRNADRVFYFDAKSHDEAHFESLSKIAEEPDHPGDLFVRWRPEPTPIWLEPKV